MFMSQDCCTSSDYPGADSMYMSRNIPCFHRPHGGPLRLGNVIGADAGDISQRTTKYINSIIRVRYHCALK